MSKQTKQAWTLTAPLEDPWFAWLDKVAGRGLDDGRRARRDRPGRLA
jgi:hypothetical protein